MENQKIEIRDLSLLRIRKVKPWKMYFDYDGRHYMLLSHDAEYSSTPLYNGSEYSFISLYEREISNNKVRLTLLSKKNTRNPISWFIKDVSKQKKRRVTYSNIDREFFVKKLVECGFSSGMFEDQWQKRSATVAVLNEEISDILREIDRINADWCKTSGHGSKCYGRKLKESVANRIEAAKPGEWCEMYSDYYGNSHPEYGGTLTDLFGLPVGTSFYVNNGCYDAWISVDEHGEKYVTTNCSNVKLTPIYHAVYISNVLIPDISDIRKEQ